jgi:hypothetical protein
MKNKRQKASIIFLLALSLGALYSCTKTDATPEAVKASTTPSFEGTAGVLWALRTVTTINTGVPGVDGITIDVGTGVGMFIDGGKNLDVGTVTLNGVALSNMSNTYMSTVSATQPTGVDFSGGIKWAITGGSGYSAFSHTVTNKFPVAGTFSSPSTLIKTDSYTIGFSSISGADSIIFVVNDVMKTVSGNTKSYTFTPAQLSKLTKGPGIVQAVPYNYKIANYGGKNLVFGNELAYSQVITIN